MNDTIVFRMCLVPHGKKVAVKNLPDGWDKADPPLTDESRLKAAEMMENMVQHGTPSLIVVSSKLRAFQTAKPAIERFVSIMGVPLLMLKSFGQPDNGDHDPDNPTADSRGLVMYGERSTRADWWQWFHETMRAIAFFQLGNLLTTNMVWGFSHRPFAAMARWISRNGLVRPTESDDFGELDPGLFPYLHLEVRFSPTDGLLAITELPRE